MGPDPGSHLGIRCRPGEGHSIFVVETHLACSPVEELGVVTGKGIISEGCAIEGELMDCFAGARREILGWFCYS